jgi:hypothetical protein
MKPKNRIFQGRGEKAVKPSWTVGKRKEGKRRKMTCVAIQRSASQRVQRGINRPSGKR